MPDPFFSHHQDVKIGLDLYGIRQKSHATQFWRHYGNVKISQVGRRFTPLDEHTHLPRALGRYKDHPSPVIEC